jgi:predicted nuclease of predicted toxin-antitoxin system
VARFHIDQNAPGRALAALLYPAGHDVKTAGDLHMTRALDAEHLLAAARAQRILVSRDHDYLDLHTAWHRWAAAWGVHPLPEHAGILIIDNH